VASGFKTQIEHDLSLIGWNPFNSNEMAVLGSQGISFYKGSSVFRIDGSNDTSFGFGGMIFLGDFAVPDADYVSHLRHEYGHILQGLVLGLPLFGVLVGIPSMISIQIDDNNAKKNKNYTRVHDYRWFERWASRWGSA
jgi:hypothetical protein